LAVQSRSSEAVQVLLATRQAKFGGLLDKAPLRRAPQKNAANLLTPRDVIDALKASFRRKPTTN